MAVVPPGLRYGHGEGQVLDAAQLPLPAGRSPPMQQLIVMITLHAQCRLSDACRRGAGAGLDNTLCSMLAQEACTPGLMLFEACKMHAPAQQACCMQATGLQSEAFQTREPPSNASAASTMRMEPEHVQPPLQTSVTSASDSHPASSAAASEITRSFPRLSVRPTHYILLHTLLQGHSAIAAVGR